MKKASGWNLLRSNYNISADYKRQWGLRAPRRFYLFYMYIIIMIIDYYQNELINY